MIEFSGELSGNAKQKFIWKQRKTGIISMAIVLPIVFIIFSTIMNDPVFTYFLLIGFVIMYLLLNFRPFTKKELAELLPKRIYVNKTHIVYCSEKYKESQEICDVSKVIDHGAYYEVRFYFGKLSDKFICQKDLLTNGSLEKFEAIFQDKLERRK